jgi:hypothetical protein
MDQASLDRLQELKEDYAALMQLEEHERLEGWERRAKVLADAVNDLHGILLREATRPGGSSSP